MAYAKMACRLLVLVLAIVTASAAGAGAGDYDTKWLNLRNACSYTVWPGITSGAGSAVPLDSTGFELAPGESRAMPVPSGWSGLVWARSLCSFATDSSGKFSCMTGDCGSGKQDCDGGGPAPPVTIAQFTLGVAGGAIDEYAVSLVDGFNLPMLVTPEGATAGGNCAPAGCVVDLNGACPPVLRVSSAAAAGAVVACKSACQAFGGLPQYCCTGEFGNPDSCRPSSYSELMKEACPRAVTYAYDAVDTMFRCGAGGIGTYTVTFCQASTSSSGRPCTTNPTSQIPETTSNTAGGGGQMSEPWRIVLAVAVLGLVSAALAVLEILFKIFSRCFCATQESIQ